MGASVQISSRPVPVPVRVPASGYLLSLTTNALSVFRCGMSESGSHVIMQYVLHPPTATD